MPSNNNANSEKSSSRNVRLLQRLIRNLLGSDSHVTRRRRSSPRLVNPRPQAKKRRYRHKKSLWATLFGGNKNWQTRLTGEAEPTESEQEPAFTVNQQDSKNTLPTRHHKKRKKRGERSFIKRFFSRRPKPENQQQQKKLSDIIRPGDHESQPLPVRRRKRKKNIFKQIFKGREKKPVKLRLPTSNEDLQAEKEKRDIREYVPYFVNSVMTFLLAYLVAWLTYQMAVMITSSFFHIDSVLFYFEVMFPIGNASELWTSLDIILITISGPLISAAAGTSYYLFIVRRNKAKGNSLMFFNWLIIHSFCMFFAAFVAGVITGQGFGYVANWMYMNVFFKILVSLVFLFFLARIGYKGAKHILETSNSIIRIKTKNRMLFMLSQTLLPWFVGSLLLVAVKYPGFTPQHENILVYDIIIIVSVLFMIIPPFFNKQDRPHLDMDKKERKQTRISRKIALITLVALLIFRVGLAGGVHFVMKLEFLLNISRYKT